MKRSSATLAATILGSSLAFIDGSVVNVALPALAAELGASPAALPWAINAYLLPLGALILLGGGLGDRFGRRRLFLVGLVTFTVASLLCAAAPSFSWMLAGRSLQGLGASLLMPNSLAILGSEFSGEARGRAIGTWAAVGALAGALGPIAGGWLVDTVGWRTIFLINVPVALAAGYLAAKFVADRPAASAAAPLVEAHQPLDALGALLATAALGLLTWSLTEASTSSRSSALPWLAAAAGATLAAVFLRHEANMHDHALMPLSLFAGRAFAALNLLTFFLYGGLGGLLVLLPFFLIRIAGWSAVAAGAALLPVPVLIGLGSRLMGRVASRRGERLPLCLGSALVAAGLALFARVGTDAISYWAYVFPPLLLIALGMSACVAPLTAGVMAAVEPRHVGIASGFNNAVARIAGLIATALLGFVFARQGSAADFVAAFHAAALAGAATAAAASGCALLLGEKASP